MKLGAVLTGVVALSALSGIMYTFVTNASPYVTIAQAKELKGEEVHVVGDIDKSTLRADALHNLVTFEITDEKKDRISVQYTGPQPANMGEARRVVVIGTLDGSKLKARQLLMKCPSKYEGKQG